MSVKTLQEMMLQESNHLHAGIIQTLARESAVLETLPFIEINGNAINYIVEESTGEVGFRDINEMYHHTSPTNLRRNEALTMLGSAVHVDRFIETTEALNSTRATATEQKVKAIANTFTNTFFNGSSEQDASSFDGLANRVIESQVLDAQGFQLHTGLLHHLVDMVQGDADVIYMNKKTRRNLNQLFERQNAFVQLGQDSYGRPVHKFADVPVRVVDDSFLPNNEVYAVKLGADGVAGIQNGGITAVDNGLQGVHYETLIEFYCSIIDANPYSFAKLEGLNLDV